MPEATEGCNVCHYLYDIEQRIEYNRTRAQVSFTTKYLLRVNNS